MVKLYTFHEHALKVTGEKHDLIRLAKDLREAGAEGTLGDLAYQIEWAFDIDGVRSSDPELADIGDRDPDLGYFAEIRWCTEDLEAALLDMGYKADEDTICRVAKLCRRPIHECSTETGWDIIRSTIESMSDTLTKL